MSEETGLDFSKTLELVILPRLDGIEAKLDRRLDAIEAKLDQKADANRLEQLEARVTRNEAWRNRVVGAVMALWAAFLACIGVALKFLH